VTTFFREFHLQTLATLCAGPLLAKIEGIVTILQGKLPLHLPQLAMHLLKPDSFHCSVLEMWVTLVIKSKSYMRCAIIYQQYMYINVWHD